MIPSVRFPHSGLPTSRLAFGLSRLHYLKTTRERQDLLAHAAALGFRHFDAARVYGDGLAEAELGRFLVGRRHDFIVATKYGLPANPLFEAWPAATWPLRGLRSVARRTGRWRNAPPPLNAADLRTSIEKSLRALRIDCVDILLLHEPSLRRLSGGAELLGELDRQKAKGCIRFVGLAGSYADVAEIAARHEPLAEIVQVPESEWSGEGRAPDLTFGALRRGPQSAFASSLEPTGARERLAAALRRRPNGTVIVSTTRMDHLDMLAAVAAGETA